MSSSSSNHGKKRYTLTSTTAISLGCSSRLCRRPKLSAIFHPRPRRRQHHLSSATPSSTTTATFSDSSNRTASATATDSYYTNSYSSSSDNNNHNSNVGRAARDGEDDDVKSLRAVQGFGRIGGASVAVEIDSDDIYFDFRQSMLQMILEREIYSREDLKELLNCFLQLNSPYYHGIIVRAFTEIWNGVYNANNVVVSPGAGAHGLWMSRDY